MRNQDLAAAMEGLSAALYGKSALIVGGVSPPEAVVEAADRIVREFKLTGVRYGVKGEVVFFEPDTDSGS